MKKWTAWLLVVAMLCAFVPFPASFAEEGVLYIPTNTETIEDEAFSGNTSIREVFIPENVKSIGFNAFAGCTNLEKVYINSKSGILIAGNAFANCGDVHFIVYPGTPAELYALAHGFFCDLIVPGTPFYERVMALIHDHGGESPLNGIFDSMRLIVRRTSNRLPDISEFNPTEITRKGDVFIVQFETDDDVRGCYDLLIDAAESSEDFVEPDHCVAVGLSSDDVEAAGVIKPTGWGTDDPMGFDTYAPFVAQNSSGSVTIAVIDSGIDSSDSSYSGRLDYAHAINMVDDEESWSSDRKGHGSYVASVINECVGDANVKILPIRVIGNSGSGNTNGELFLSPVLAGVEYAIDSGASIINMSMGWKTESSAIKHAIRKAVNCGKTVVVSAGNTGADTAGFFPANMPEVITVAGIDSDFKVVSNYGASVDYCAPYTLFSTSRGVNEGTSFSAPMIASALALVSLDPYHSLADMNATCVNTNETGSDSNSYGFGMPLLNKLADIPVINLSLDSNLPSTLTVGQKIELKWSVSPSNATNQLVSVSSSDPDVVEIENNADGTVFLNALKKGTAALTVVSDSNPDVSVSMNFAVVQPVISISILGAKDKLVLGKTMKLSAVVLPYDANQSEIEWVSTNENVATVSQNGLVSGVGEGTVGIYARAKDGYGAQSAMVSFPVIPIPDPESVTLTINGQDVTGAKYSMAPGETARIQVKVLPEEAEQSVVFSSYGNYVSVTQDGIVTANSAGTAYVNVAAEADRDVAATVEIEVRVRPTSINISGNTVIDVGATSQLTASIVPSDTTNKQINWKSSDATVATVNQNGLVSGLKSGTALITATSADDPEVSKTVTVTVRHPYTLNFNANSPESGLSPSLSATSKSAISGEVLGDLPTASCDYYDFLGWYTTAGDDGQRRNETSVIETADSSVTLYAHWRIHDESAWTLASQVPAGGRITQTSYSYRESTESTNSSMAGWISSGNYWKQTGSGWKYYASFPSTYNTKDQYYKSYMKSPYSEYENDTTKRTVSNVQDGWIYWHWMYNVAYASGTRRTISWDNKTHNSWSYQYWHSMASSTKCSYLSKDYCYGGSHASYNCKSVVSAMTTSAQRKDPTSGIGTDRYFAIDRMKSSYTDYQKIYQYYRDLNYQTQHPGSGSNISNLTTYVKYRAK